MAMAGRFTVRGMYLRPVAAALLSVLLSGPALLHAAPADAQAAPGPGPAPAVEVSDDTLLIIHLDRPPLYGSLDGRPVGIINGLLDRVLERAGIPARWEPAPTNRILASMREGRAAFCSPGWFRTEERTQWARFSVPLYPGRPMVALVPQALAGRVARLGTLAAVAADPDLRMGAVSGFRMGDYVEAQMDRMGERVTFHAVPLPQLVRMTAARRFDLVLAEPEEAAFHMEGASPGELAVVPLADIPPGPDRHIMCSMTVADSVMRRIDQAIAEVVP